VGKAAGVPTNFPLLSRDRGHGAVAPLPTLRHRDWEPAGRV